MARPRVKPTPPPQPRERPERRSLPSNPTRGAMTLEEVGAALDITRERARQIEAVALRKLKVRLRAKGINPEDILPNDWERKEPSIYDPF